MGTEENQVCALIITFQGALQNVQNQCIDSKDDVVKNFGKQAG